MTFAVVYVCVCLLFQESTATEDLKTAETSFGGGGKTGSVVAGAGKFGKAGVAAAGAKGAGAAGFAAKGFAGKGWMTNTCFFAYMN